MSCPAPAASRITCFGDADGYLHGPTRHAGGVVSGADLPGLTSFLGRDPESDVTLVIWANLTFSADG